MIKGINYRKTFTHRDDAREWLRRLERQAAGLVVETPRLALAPCIEAYRQHLVDHNRAVETRIYYERIGATLAAHLGPGADLAALTQEAVRAFVAARRAAGAGDARIAKELSALHAMSKLAGLTPGWKVPSFSRAPAPRRLPPDHEVAAVYRALSRPDLSRAFLLALLCGLRPSEVHRAEWSWVDLQARTLTVQASKAGGEHQTYITDTLAAALATPGLGRIVPLSETAIRSAVYRRSVTLELAHPWTGLEALRHACATWAFAAGFTTYDCDVLLSHKVTSVARVSYLHAHNLPLKRRMLEAVEARFLAALASQEKRAEIVPKP